MLLTSHREDPRWRRLPVGRHRRHPEGRGRLSDWRHGQAGRGHDGRGRKGDHARHDVDVVNNEGVVAVVKRTEVSTDAKSLFWGRETGELLLKKGVVKTFHTA